MLSLSTHEPHFYVIRESIETDFKKWGQIDKGSFSDFVIKFIFVQINIVREFIEDFMKNSKIPFGKNLENIIDDFVLMCFIVGNDFLPNIPGFNIRNAGIDILLSFYE